MEERTALVAVAARARLAALGPPLLVVMVALEEQARLLVLRSCMPEAVVVLRMAQAAEPLAQAGRAAEALVAQAMPLAAQQALAAVAVVQKD